MFNVFRTCDGLFFGVVQISQLGTRLVWSFDIFGIHIGKATVYKTKVKMSTMDNIYL